MNPKNRKRLTFGLAILFFAFIFLLAGHMTVWAQVPGDSAIAPGSAVGDAIPSSWWKFIWTGYAILEVIIRRFPTVGNYSPIGWVIKVIQTIAPNNNVSTPSQPHP